MCVAYLPRHVWGWRSNGNLLQVFSLYCMLSSRIEGRFSGLAADTCACQVLSSPFASSVPLPTSFLFSHFLSPIVSPSFLPSPIDLHVQGRGIALVHVCSSCTFVVEPRRPVWMSSPSTFFGTSSNLLSRLSWLSRKPQGHACLWFSGTGITSTCHYV